MSCSIKDSWKEVIFQNPMAGCQAGLRFFIFCKNGKPGFFIVKWGSVGWLECSEVTNTCFDLLVSASIRQGSIMCFFWKSWALVCAIVRPFDLSFMFMPGNKGLRNSSELLSDSGLNWKTGEQSNDLLIGWLIFNRTRTTQWLTGSSGCLGLYILIGLVDFQIKIVVLFVDFIIK